MKRTTTLVVLLMTLYLYIFVIIDTYAKDTEDGHRTDQRGIEEAVNTNDVDALLRRVKRHLSSAKLEKKAGRIDRAVDSIEEAKYLLDKWSESLKRGTNDRTRSHPDADETTKKARVSTETFRFERTFIPERCVRLAEENGDYVKIQYVGWILPEKKMFASSFHTGSLPKKIVLGSSDLVAGVDIGKGLRGACRKERRNIYIPAEMAFGARGHKEMNVPGNADLKFSVEVTEVGRDRTYSRKDGDL